MFGLVQAYLTLRTLIQLNVTRNHLQLLPYKAKSRQWAGANWDPKAQCFRYEHLGEFAPDPPDVIVGRNKIWQKMSLKLVSKSQQTLLC